MTVANLATDDPITEAWVDSVTNDLNALTNARTVYVPTIAQGATPNIAKTVNYSEFVQAGKFVTWVFTLSLTGAGTAGSIVTVTLPITAAHASGLNGKGAIFDASAALRYMGIWESASTTLVQLGHDGSGVSAWGAAPNIALAAGDVLRGEITYEAA